MWFVNWFRPGMARLKEEESWEEEGALERSHSVPLSLQNATSVSQSIPIGLMGNLP